MATKIEANDDYVFEMNYKGRGGSSHTISIDGYALIHEMNAIAESPLDQLEKEDQKKADQITVQAFRACADGLPDGVADREVFSMAIRVSNAMQELTEKVRPTQSSATNMVSQ